jgi:hypothetical protein
VVLVVWHPVAPPVQVAWVCAVAGELPALVPAVLEVSPVVVAVQPRLAHCAVASDCDIVAGTFVIGADAC